MTATAEHSFTLRPLQGSDAPIILQGRNSGHIRPHMLSQHIISEHDHAQWMETRLKTMKEFPYFLFLENSPEERPIGLVGLSHFDRYHSRGEWGFYVWAQDAPKHSGTRMLSAFMDEIFEHHNVKTLSAQVLASNERSVHLHQKLGFKPEGTLKAYAVRPGIIEDVALFSLSKEEWQALRTRFISLIGQVTIISTHA